ncbi:MAG: hypothetical protein EXR93_07845 [Gemmatimonadetes bacterium]|nr:hypothetical protein [Gemmatimonadota bacterium]
MHRTAAFALTVLLVAPTTISHAQGSGSVAGNQRSRNVQIVAHIPGRLTDIEIEQELSRPYAYVSTGGAKGFSIINLKDPAKAYKMYTWQIENPELHQGSALAPTYLKSRGRYYFFNGFQFSRTGPDATLGAVIHDVTGLPDTSKVREVARINTPEIPGGFHETFSYKHSDGRALVFVTTYGSSAYVYDIDKVVSGDMAGALVGKVPNPDSLTPYRWEGYHDFYVGYDPASKQDRFYGAGYIGYYVFDITNLAQPRLLTSIKGVSGTDIAHTITPDPTGRYVVTEFEYTYAPLRLFDLKPRGDSLAANVSRPVGAWTASWKGLPHNHEVRWPYVFVSTYGDEFQVFNMMDPTNPYTVGYHDTSPGPENAGRGNPASPNPVESTFGVDVRNADGLIVTSGSGFWAFKMEGFDGWNGHQWGVPNVSSAQDWDHGPDGAPKPQKVSIAR